MQHATQQSTEPRQPIHEALRRVVVEHLRRRARPGVSWREVDEPGAGRAASAVLEINAGERVLWLELRSHHRGADPVPPDADRSAAVAVGLDAALAQLRLWELTR